VFRVLGKQDAGAGEKGGLLTPDEAVRRGGQGAAKAVTVELRVSEGGFLPGVEPRPMLLYWDGRLKGGGVFIVLVTDRALARLRQTGDEDLTILSRYLGRSLRVTGQLQPAGETSAGP